MILCDAKVYVDGRFDSACEVRVEDGRIAALGTRLEGQPRVSLGGAYLLPGLIDLHTHGAFGHSAMGGEADLRAMAQALVQTGVTAFVPTVSCAPIGQMREALRDIDAVRRWAHTWRGRFWPIRIWARCAAIACCRPASRCTKCCAARTAPSCAC